MLVIKYPVHYTYVISIGEDIDSYSTGMFTSLSHVFLQ